jgi:hypothetical protein
MLKQTQNVNQQTPAPAPKKSYLKTIIIISVVLVLFIFFSAFAQFFLSPGLMLAALDKITGGKMKAITNSLNSSLNVGNLIGTGAHSSEDYLIKQKSSAPVSISAPKGAIDAKADIDFITTGSPMSKAKAGNYGWQADWKVIINSITRTGTKTQMKDPASGLKTSALTTSFTPESMQYVYYFSLSGLKEGDTFQARYVVKKLSEATYHFNEKDWIFYDQGNRPAFDVKIGTQERTTDIPDPSTAKTANAILLKNNGEDGAIVGFPPQEMTKEQKAQLEAANQVMNSAGGGDLQNWWNSKLYPMFTHLPQMPPFKIVLKSGLPEKGYFEDKITNADYWNTAPGVNVKNVNPNDKNGDGVPDLVPLGTK